MIFGMPSTAMPPLAQPEPIKPPTSACDELEGRPRQVHAARVDDAFADGVRDVQREHEERQEVEGRGPGHGHARRQHTRRDDRGDRVRCVVEAVDVVERQRDEDDRNDE
jgi:hypothetical protein